MFLRSTASNQRVFHKALKMTARHCAQCLLVPTSTELVSAVSVVFLWGSLLSDLLTVSTERCMARLDIGPCRGKSTARGLRGRNGRNEKKGSQGE